MTDDLSKEALDALCNKATMHALAVEVYATKSQAIVWAPMIRDMVKNIRAIVSENEALKDRAEKAEVERDAALAGAVRVRALEWEEYFTSNGRRLITYSVTPLVTYRITQKFFPETFFSIEGVDGFFFSADTIESAKAAAQADYERRILAALEPKPPHRETNDIPPKSSKRV